MKIRIPFVASLVALGAGWIAAQGAAAKVEVPFFGNEKCPVTGKAVDASLSATWQGERIYACSQECLTKIKADAAAFHAKAYPKERASDLKNALCPIRGQPAKADVATVFQGRKVRFCCPGCDQKFREEPARHLALLSRKGLRDAGNARCPIMTENDVAPDSFLVYGDLLVGICCPECAGEFAKDPEKHLKALGVEGAKPPSEATPPAGGHEHGKPAGGHQHEGKDQSPTPPAPGGGCCGSGGHRHGS